MTDRLPEGLEDLLYIDHIACLVGSEADVFRAKFSRDTDLSGFELSRLVSAKHEAQKAERFGGSRVCGDDSQKPELLYALATECSH